MPMMFGFSRQRREALEAELRRDGGGSARVRGAARLCHR